MAHFITDSRGSVVVRVAIAIGPDHLTCHPCSPDWSPYSISPRCFGCASASVEHCLALLRALATRPKTRSLLCREGLIRQLLEYNLRRGSLAVRAEVRRLITFLTKDNLEATRELNRLLFDKVGL